MPERADLREMGANLVMFYQECVTPVGSLLVVTDAQSRLTHVIFDAATDQRELARAARARNAQHSVVQTWLAVEQLQRYFAADSQYFDLALNLHGTAFQRSIWAYLQRIPFAGTQTYGQVANALGRPHAARAVGAANGQNPISIIVPCHRLVSSTGGLAGYAGGLAAKRWLLAFEAEQAGLQSPWSTTSVTSLALRAC